MTRKAIVGMVLGLAVSATATFAEEAAEPSAYDKIWDTATVLVDNSDGPIQKIVLTGRLQGDAVSFHSQDSNYDDLDWRRFRIGFKASVFNDLLLHVEMDGDMNDVNQDAWDKFYGRLTDAYVGWKACKEATVKVGKQSAGFTLDGATSSKKLIVPERSIVAENLWFTTEYFSGAAVSGDVEGWSYNAGAFSASGENEFGHFESGYFALLSAGHKIGDKGSLRLDYVYNDPDFDSDYSAGTKKLEHIAALVYKDMLSEKIGLWSDLAVATGLNGQSDLLGVDIMPFYNISDELQLVLQYAGVTSLDNQSDVKMSRYAGKNAGGDKVETAHNFLLGFNWYLYGHKLKWQNAVEYNYGKSLASGGDYNGYGLTSALRISW
jgi:phosphate-selective porin OprO/OprP